MTGLMRCCLQGLICTAPFGMKHPILGLAMPGLGRVLRVGYVPGLSQIEGHGLKMKEAKTAIITPPFD